MMKRKLLVVLLCLFFIHTKAQEFVDFKKEVFVQNLDTLQYRILFPEGMEKGKKYPLVLFLHGSGERGSDNQKQLTHGAALFLDPEMRRKYPAVVLFPQCPTGIMWTNRKKERANGKDWQFQFPLEPGPTTPARLVNQLVEELMASGTIDPDRVYIMGLSMGGIGTLEFLCRWPEKYAGAIVICGGHDPQWAEKYCRIPVWFFHGAKDDVVPPRYSQAVYDELKKCNAKTRYTLYPEANHNSWDSAFAEPDLLEWLFTNCKSNRE